MIPTKQLPMRGITLLISVILTTVILSVALALLDITYKQVLLASSSKQSQYAFYNADAAMECALYFDQKADAFDYNGSSYLTTGFTCSDNSGNAQNITLSSSQAGGTRTTTFSIPCTGGGTQGMVSVSKDSTGATKIFATGYNTCSVGDPRRIERGLKVLY